MLAIELPVDLEKRLTAIAAKTGQSEIFHAQQAIAEHLDDLEDHFTALERLEADEPTLSLSEMERRLGLAD